jgi:hypothetical protein
MEPFAAVLIPELGCCEETVIRSLASRIDLTKSTAAAL